MDATPGGWLPLCTAWEDALYGSGGFYRTARPGDHFRTSSQVGPVFAASIRRLARSLGHRRIVDVGAGSGELLLALHELDPELELTGVDLRPRPGGLAPGIGWTTELPDHLDGLVVANELLDNLPCDVVELARDGNPRLVEVQPATGAERLGEPAGPETRDWLDRWWPLTTVGARAEVGLIRDRFWADVCRRTADGACLAIDYGHRRGDRPPGPTLTSYRRGRQLPVAYSGDRDLTADVAVDAVAAAVGADVRRQSDSLADLGVRADRPPLDLARSEPAAYLRLLSAAGDAAELTSSPGLGDFWWLLCRSDPPGAVPVADPGVGA